MTSCALSTNTEQIIQHGKNCSSQGCENFGLTKKTKVMYQPAPGKPYQEPHITVKGQNLQAVDNFTYLGSTLSKVVHIDTEVNNRIAKASVTFGRLRENVWERIAIRLSTKLKVYHAVVLTTSSLLMWDLDCVQQTRTRQPAQSYPPELPAQTSPHQMAGQKSWHGGHRKGGHPQRWYPLTENPGYMGRPCRQNTWLPTTSRYCRENSVKASGLLGQKKSFKDMHQRRPRSLSSTWLSSTFEGRTTTNTMAENNSHSAQCFNSRDFICTD